ncbi:MAG: hypothetical protein K2Y37_22855 [Pirellulales bacterium]|nr:hypothetical protein [Pirellulales bacterium]
MRERWRRTTLVRSVVVGCASWLAVAGAAAVDPPPRFAPPKPPRVVELERLKAAGIRRLASQHLVLYTDLPSESSVDALPEQFDQAVPQWIAYFKDALPSDKSTGESAIADWRAVGYLIKDKERFVATGLLTDEVPQFLHGYSIDHEFWLNEQPSEYFRRHLMLHEGTHVFMRTQLGSTGPPWYMEGMAEWLATHRLRDGHVELAYFPRSRAEVPYWGRIKIIQDDVVAGRRHSLAEVFALAPRAYLQTGPYGWSWGAVALLADDPRYSARFRELAGAVNDPQFNQRLRGRFADDWPQLSAQWQAFIGEIDYGYDVAAAAIEFAPGEPLGDKSVEVTVDAARSWQSSKVRVEAGKTYRLTAAGRYQIARDEVDGRERIWWCEPGGVSIHYYRGRPLGQLTAAIVPDETLAVAATAKQPLWQPITIGLEAELKPETSGTLYLRVNEFPGRLADNAGELAVKIQSP